MAIEEKSGLFYEILIRGYAGGDHVEGKTLGEFAGAHYIEGTAILKDGALVAYTPGHAEVLPREKIVDYLGEKFAGFEEGQRKLAAQLAQAERDFAAQLKQQQNEFEAQLAAARDELAAARAQHRTDVAELNAAREALQAKVNAVSAALA